MGFLLWAYKLFVKPNQVKQQFELRLKVSVSVSVSVPVTVSDPIFISSAVSFDFWLA